MGREVVIGAVAGLLLVWATLIVALYIVGRGQDDQTTFTDVLRLLPDVVRLLRRLAPDGTLPRGARIRLGLLIAYLLFPLDLVPDFIPVVGSADDAIIVALALRPVTRVAGPEALDKQWPGTPEGLRALKRLAGVVDQS